MTDLKIADLPHLKAFDHRTPVRDLNSREIHAIMKFLSKEQKHIDSQEQIDILIHNYRRETL